MNTAPKPQNSETKMWLTTRIERAKALDPILACGGEIAVAAPLSLRGRGGKKLEAREPHSRAEGHSDLRKTR
jgi:hypothetical protein